MYGCSNGIQSLAETGTIQMKSRLTPHCVWLSSHIQSLWDRYLTSILDKYVFDRRNVDIAGLLFLPYRWISRWFFLISGTSEVPNIFTTFLNGPQKYRDFLCEFFEDQNRSGKYHVDGMAYAHAVLECFRNMINPNAE